MTDKGLAPGRRNFCAWASRSQDRYTFRPADKQPVELRDEEGVAHPRRGRQPADLADAARAILDGHDETIAAGQVKAAPQDVARQITGLLTRGDTPLEATPVGGISRQHCRLVLGHQEAPSRLVQVASVGR